MFKTRLLSGIVLIVVLLVLGVSGGEVLLAGLAAISLIGLYELYAVFQLEKSRLGIVGYIMTIGYYFLLKIMPEFLHKNVDLFVFSMLCLIIMMCVYVFCFPKYKAEQVMIAYFAIFYVAVMLSCVYQTRMLENGKYLIWLIFLCSWGCDTCAYCVGMLIGKHKMAPVLSPKKTIEGAVGGVIGAAVLTIVYGFVFQEAMNMSTNRIYVMAVICAVGALISMVGDLAASAIKRNYNVKDYGTLIPGHGGVLDRFDSVIFTAPIIYFLALYFI